ncbi:ATP-binding protein [Streptosporangium subroseum]|uniref:ATP-binding protein n=1 Tax=Streptosporangium subroseum TaxID=106412 RepID=UPI00308BE578|nr:ATP-binding protein [Streptosporangium subroseum]
MNPETFREIYLPGNPESASQARDEIGKWLGESHPAYENARLAVSELVTNAVRHARYGIAGLTAADPLLLRLVAYGGLLRIEVVDAGLSAGEPRVRADPACLLMESGRGLAIVEALSGGSWGHRSHGRAPGRTVWCELPADPQPVDECLAGTSAPRSSGDPSS